VSGVIREATASDAATIVRLVIELATFEGLADEVRITEADVLRDGFGERPRFKCLLVEVDGQAMGMALYFATYSTFEGRANLYVEDLYLAESARGQGLGRKLLARLAAIALERGCRRLDLEVLDWNPARDFYDRLGFQHREGWLPYRLGGDALQRLAAADGDPTVKT
jgi:GNAT superfamily N-acetyltransferase